MKYLFENCELDVSTQELRISGQPVKIEPQVFDLLTYLIQHRSRLVSHDELVTEIWRNRVVSDSAISARISLARKAVGDNGKAQKVIKTVSRKGYKFLPQVELIDGKEGRPDVISSQDTAPGNDTGKTYQEIHFCRSANGARIAWATSGAGTPLVRTGHWLTHIEHDWHSPVWRPFLNELGKRFEVNRYDQRGCGLSDWDITDFSFGRFAEDLEAVIESSGHQRFVLYATSQGVPLAINYAAKHPDRVSHLICHGGYVTGRLVRDDSAEVEQGEAILKLIEHGWGKRNSPFLKSFTTMYIPDASTEQMDSLVDLQRQTTSSQNAMAIRRAADSFDVSKILPQVTVKTLIIHAANDGVHPIEQSRELATGIEGSKFVVLDSQNHTVLPEEPAWSRFFEEVTRFVEPDC